MSGAAGRHTDRSRTKWAAPGRKRRGVLGMLLGSAVGVGFSALGLTGSLWTLAAGRFMFPNTLKEPPTRFKVGFPGDYPRGTVETKHKDRHGVWVVHGTYRGRPQIYALATECTHLGCVVIWQEAHGRFKCPCHGSAFYPSGINYEGPAPRPLARYAIRVADDGQLEVDTSVTFQEELGQWDDPACYVLV